MVLPVDSLRYCCTEEGRRGIAGAERPMRLPGGAITQLSTIIAGTVTVTGFPQAVTNCLTSPLTFAQWLANLILARRLHW